MYNVLFTKTFKKDFKKLDKHIQILIKNWINKNLVNSNNPYMKGKRLKGKLSDYWRYRIGDYRLLVRTDDDLLVILLIKVGHRKSIYE